MGSTVPVTIGTSEPDNGIVTVNATTTQIVPADPNGSRSRDVVILNVGNQTVFIRGGANAATTHFPLYVGARMTRNTALAINGIVATGTGSVAVISEAR